jgi:hypothetical protein
MVEEDWFISREEKRRGRESMKKSAKYDVIEMKAFQFVGVRRIQLALFNQAKWIESGYRRPIGFWTEDCDKKLNYVCELNLKANVKRKS